MGLQPHHPTVLEGTSGDVTVVHFTGSKVSLDEETLDHVHDELFALADEPSESDVFLDLGNVNYLTSTTLGALVSLHKKLLARGRHLTLGNLSPQVHEVFTVTRLDKLLDLRLAGQEFAPAARRSRPADRGLRDLGSASGTPRSGTRAGHAAGIPGLPAGLPEMEQLETRVQSRLNGLVRNFRLVLRGCGLILTGQARTYHAKQLAQYAVMEATALPILANEIDVC